MLKSTVAAALAAVVISAVPASAQEPGVELGMLDCAIEGGTGFIIGSRKDMRCTFTSANQTFAPESYFGVVSKWGIDIGSTDGAVMRWLVLAPSNNIYAPGALAPI